MELERDGKIKRWLNKTRFVSRNHDLPSVSGDNHRCWCQQRQYSSLPSQLSCGGNKQWRSRGKNNLIISMGVDGQIFNIFYPNNNNELNTRKILLQLYRK